MSAESRNVWVIWGALQALACSGAQSTAPSSMSGSGAASGAPSGALSGSGVASGATSAASSGAASGGQGFVDGGSGSVVATSGTAPDAGTEGAAGMNDAAGIDAVADAPGAPDADASAWAPFCVPGTAGNGSSTLTGGDPPEWQLRAGLAPGRLTPSASFSSSTYGLHFPYVVYTSANYVAGQPAVFLLFGDGISMYLNGGFHAATVLDNLTGAGEIPPVVALFIDPPSDGGNPTAVRVQTYDPPTDKYPTFLMTEIVPQVITSKYSVAKDPGAWAIVGYSASGGQGWNVVWKRPDNFHKFIGSNASYGAANVAMYGNVNWGDVITNSPKHDIRASNVTCAHDLSDQRGSWLTIITNLAMALKAKGYDERLMTGPNGHYPPIDGERDFPNSLRWLFQGCRFAPGTPVN